MKPLFVIVFTLLNSLVIAHTGEFKCTFTDKIGTINLTYDRTYSTEMLEGKITAYKTIYCVYDTDGLFVSEFQLLNYAGDDFFIFIYYGLNKSNPSGVQSQCVPDKKLTMMDSMMDSFANHVKSGNEMMFLDYVKGKGLAMTYVSEKKENLNLIEFDAGWGTFVFL